MSLSTSPLSEDWAMAPKTPPMNPPDLPPLTPPSLLPRSPSPVIRCIDEVPIATGKSPASAVKKPPIRHSKYYIDEQMAIFLVDNHLYKVHRHFLRQESHKFDEMLDHLPPDQGGETDENPIVLPEVTQGEFEALLEYFYAGLYFKAAENRPRPLQEYIDLLSIATRYDCTDARIKAIDGIESHRPNAVQRIVLAEKFDIPSWLKPAYIELCGRDKPLELSEGEQLGLQKVILIARAREEIGADDRVSRSVSPTEPCYIPVPAPRVPRAPVLDPRVSRIVNEIFFPSPPVPELAQSPPWYPPKFNNRPDKMSWGAKPSFPDNLEPEKEKEEKMPEKEKSRSITPPPTKSGTRKIKTGKLPW
ncbi:hypothetical protein E1B28_006530 [Marasmius oreades]|uniref:BTB domain-containing protein n=1 Tax=Marasmius oreades TaxID=181124 RepID=A0A9P7S5Z1_9AGAR|nr:uncharacterized protein E1B28_006530 [Marasmius oreades]KAG7095835.1 hypothetical protein E1B28_006530 [Marasmius oreades]